MFLPTADLPPHGGYIHAVRESCRAVRISANISVQEDAVKSFLLSPAFSSTYAKLRKSHGYVMPLKFPSVIAELNLLSILSLLNFGSGYRVPLHVATGRGAFDNIRALVFGLYISSTTGTGEGDYLSALGMSEVKEHTIADLMGVAGALHVERAHDSIPGVTVGELGGPIWELVGLITRTLNETGTVLVETGYPDLGSFLMEALKEGEKVRGQSSPEGTDMMCDVVLERLVRVFPAFRDMATVNNRPVHCFKKALLTIHSVALRFGASGSQTTQVPVPDTTHLPIFVDNVIPSLLVHLGILDLSASLPSLGLVSAFPHSGRPETLETLLAASEPAGPETLKVMDVPKEGPLLRDEQAYVLRAAAVDACEMIVETARELGATMGNDAAWLKDITPPELDAWIWAAAKDRPDYRKLERFAERNTPFF